jgi:hypothetical protein
MLIAMIVAAGGSVDESDSDRGNHREVVAKARAA